MKMNKSVVSPQNIAAATGPITLVTSKHRRVTIFEAPANDIAAQMDLAKVADLCLIMINALVGFEMETFEFINVLQNHGFPKILGVLTHLDGFAETKAIRYCFFFTGSFSSSVQLVL